MAKKLSTLSSPQQQSKNKFRNTFPSGLNLISQFQVTLINPEKLNLLFGTKLLAFASEKLIILTQVFIEVGLNEFGFCKH